MYLLCKIFEGEPDLFPKPQPDQITRRDDRMEPQAPKKPSLCDTPSIEDEDDVSPPPSASRVYHASLKDEEHLDGIPATFNDQDTTDKSDASSREIYEAADTGYLHQNGHLSTQTTSEQVKPQRMQLREAEQSPCVNLSLGLEVLQRRC